MYPRTKGSEIVVSEDDWNRSAPFGHCPACGSIGIEEYPCAGSDKAFFVCSDEKCETTGFRRTMWSEVKPPEWR